ncbi:MAG TPA: AAA family ATPase [Tepidisphaeraceae bacterium]|nr:AAA family ATPase [Tepidisphaeraceae bacterium]
MRTIAIINQKGGCGKTTTSINLAACLARLGQKTLLVDIDPQGHCGVGLAVPEEQIEKTLFDALIESKDGKPAKVGDIVWQIASDFDLAPANIKLAAFEQLFAGREGREDRLVNALASVQSVYKWCIIDCPPSVGLLTFNALRACDEVLVPVETGFFSLHGLSKMMETLEVLKEKCGHDLAIRVLPPLYDTRTKLAREVLSELRNKFQGYLMASTINFNTKLKEAASFGQPITEYDPGSRGYKDFVNLAKELMGECPVETEVAAERLSRPAELVQRAKQLAQLSNFQFGRTTVTEERIGEPANGASASSVGPRNGDGAIGGRIAELVAAPPTRSVARSTERKLEEFYGVKQVGNRVVFRTKFDADNVHIAGDFNNWQIGPGTMENADADDEWRLAVSLNPGRYRYRMVVDGKWITDPNNQYVETNQFGELNNIFEVE